MKKQDHRTEQTNHARSLGRCKVCTKQLRVGEDHVTVFHGGTSYLVCCASCATKFEADPRHYLVS